jgi:DNA-binding SARP family transcriptional activator
VFDDLAPEAQRVLMQLAFLPQMTLGLAERLTGSAEAPRLLEQFYKRHWFTDRRRVAGGAASHVFQFHALFRTFLRHQASASLSEDVCRRIAQRAGHLLADDGLPEQALECLAEAQDWSAHADTVLAHAEALIEQGRGQTLLDWLARLPQAQRDARPWLGYWAGRAQMASAPDRAIPLLQQVHARFQDSQDAAGQLACGAAIIQTLWYARLGWSEITAWVDRLEPLMRADAPWPVADGNSSFPSRGVELLSVAALHASLAFCRLQHPALREMASQLLALIDDDSIDWNHRLAAATHLITWFHNAADHRQATQLIGRVDPVVDRRPSSALNRAFWFTFRAIHDMRLGRDEQSAALFQRAEDLAHEQGLARAEYAAIQFHTFLDLLFRRADEAQARVARLEVHPARGNLDAQLNLCVIHTMLAQLRGRPEVALSHAQQALQAIERVGAAYFHAMYQPAVASAFADAGQPEQALQLLAASRELVQGSYMDALHAQLQIEQAYVALTRGDADGTRALLAEGLSLAARDPARAAYVHRIVARKPALLVRALRERIEPALVREMIQRWRVPPPPDVLSAWPWAVSVRTLGVFEVRVHDEPLAFGRKAPKKTLALLKALVARGGAATDSVLIDLFWPDEPGDAAAKSLGAAVHRLRQLLTVPDAVLQQGGQVSLDRDLVWVDAWSFERGLAADDARTVVDALELYRGAFLAEEEGESWPVALRERLRGKFVHAVAEHAARLEAAQRHEEAIGWYLRGIDADPVVELFYQGLMRCYHRLDRLPEAVSAYRRLKQVLSVTLSLPPSEGTERLYRSLRSA